MCRNRNHRLDDVPLKRLCGVPIPFPPRYSDDPQYQRYDQAPDAPNVRISSHAFLFQVLHHQISPLVLVFCAPCYP